MSETIRTTGNEALSLESPSALVVETLASASGVDPSDLDICLFEYVDPCALDRLFSNPLSDTPRKGSVTLSIEAYCVTLDVAGDGTVEVSVERAGETNDALGAVAQRSNGG